jgi:L-fucose mutarotase
MLKGLDPLLNADVLHALRAMGHGDRVAIADTNFPSDAIARRTALGRLLRIDASAARVARAVLSVMPLDRAVEHAAFRMEVMGAPDEVPDVQGEVQEALTAAEPGVTLKGIERFAFYEEAKGCYAVITTAERRFYGCFILAKGVVPPDA